MFSFYKTGMGSSLSVTPDITELFQHNLINDSYLTACYIYQVMMTLHFLNDVANDAESTQNKKYVIIAILKIVQHWEHDK